MQNGIDVASVNGMVDWEQVKAAGMDFAIIRAGWTFYEGGLEEDRLFARNMEGAAAAGLDIGVYVYSYDRSPQAARTAAQRLDRLLQPYKTITYPVWFDIEDRWNLTAGKQLNTQICQAFLSSMEEAGYYTGIYSFANFLTGYLDREALSAYDVWVADYREPMGYDGPFGMWQYGIVGSQGLFGRDYTIRGQVPGLSGNCDVDYAYKDYPTIIRRAGLNHLDPYPEPGPDPEPDPDPDPKPDPEPNPDCEQAIQQLEKAKEALAWIERIASQVLEE